MTKYHKINSPFKRDMEAKPPHMIFGNWSMPEFSMLADCPWYGWEKIDGTNIRVIYSPLYKEVEFRGRTDNADIPKHLLEVLKEKFTVEKFQKHYSDLDEMATLVLYGEGTGYKIQSGCKYWGGEKKVDFILFDAKIERWWMQRDFVDNASKIFNVVTAPYLGEKTLNEWFMEERKGQQSQFGDFIREGVIVRPRHELFTRSGLRLITKIKYKDFKNF